MRFLLSSRIVRLAAERRHLLQVVVVQPQLLEAWVAKSGEIGAGRRRP